MDNISKSLDETLLSKSTDDATKAMKDLSADLVEINLDTLVNNDIVKELPVVKTLLIAPKVIKGISDYIFLKKILRFLFQLENTTLKEREEFLGKLEGSKREELLSNLILILDKHDHLHKSELQGKLFSTYIKGVLNYDEYMALTYSLNMMDVKALPALVSFYVGETSHTLKPETIYNFIFLQLIRIDNSLIGTFGGGGPTYERNRLGMLMVEICTDGKIPQDYKDKILGKSK